MLRGYPGPAQASLLVAARRTTEDAGDRIRVDHVQSKEHTPLCHRSVLGRDAPVLITVLITSSPLSLPGLEGPEATCFLLQFEVLIPSQ